MGSDLFSIAELSDGERNALLIAADILTVKPVKKSGDTIPILF
jgi:hypothetical protein